MKPARGFIQILIVAVIAFSFGAAAIFGYQKFLKKSPAVDQKTETQSSPLASVDETANPDSIGANWKTYTSEKMGFSIQYPPDMSVVAAPPPIELNSASFLLSFPRESDIPPFSQQILIYKKDVMGGLSIEQSITSYDPSSIKSVPITIGGKNGLFFETVPAYSDASDAFVIKGSQIWSFRLTGSGVHENKIPVFNQILSTFQFLN